MDTLGEFLKKERESRGFSMEQVHKATRISRIMLEALENDYCDQLPAKPFVKGFVVNYCKFLKIDSKDVIDKFLENNADPSTTPGVPCVQSADSGKEEASQNNIINYWVYGLMAAAIIVIVVFASGRWGRESNLPSLTGTEEKSAQPFTGFMPVAATETSPEEDTEPTGVATIVETEISMSRNEAASAPVNEPMLRIIAREESWIRYSADGVEEKQFTLDAGKSMQIRAENSIQLHLGNAEGVDLILKGKPLPKMIGKVRHLVINLK
jgi:cytoskeletal protein RodZ